MSITDLEQKILNLISLENDIELFHYKLCESEKPLSDDEISNHLLALQTMINLRGDALWDCFEKVVKEFHHYRKIAEDSE